MLRMAGFIATICASTILSGVAIAQGARSDTGFLAFPMVTETSASDNGSFAWLVRQGDTSTVMFASAPGFQRVKLASRNDHDGSPIVAVTLSPAGDRAVFQTAEAAGARSYNPASLNESPVPTLWISATSGSAAPAEIGPGRDPIFSPDGRLVLFRRDADLWAYDVRDLAGQPKLFAKNGASFGSPVWTKDGDLLFVQDRGGYSFLGRYRPGADRVQWLVTGVDRIASPVISPDGSKVAFLRIDGRRHGVTYDRTEAEAFAVDLLDLRSGSIRTLWSTREKALGSWQDRDSGLRWIGNDRLVFLSEHDGFARLYALSDRGGESRPLTATRCEVAETEQVDDKLLVIHNCRNIDERQLSIIDPATGAETRLASTDTVIGAAAAAGGNVALVGATADQSPLLRVIDARSGAAVMRESYSNYGYRERFSAPAPRSVRLTAADGVQFSGQLFLPKSGGRHPALVYVHGGPQRQMFPAFHYMGYYATDFAVNRHLADQGYVVLSINYRSGIGYGRQFREAEGRGWRAASEYADVLAAGRWLAARSDVDPGRIGIWGGSYGGLLTGQALARNSDLFKSGVALHGVFDWSWPSPKAGHLNPSVFFGVAEADRQRALAASPLGALAGWRSPVLLISGDQDMNVDVAETVDLAQRLRERGVEVQSLILPGEAHDFVQHSSWQRIWHAMNHFLEAKLVHADGKPAGTVASTKD